MEKDNSMIHCDVTHYQKVKKIMTAPDVYPTICDDGSPRPEDFQVRKLLEAPDFFFLMPNDGTVFMIAPFCFCTFMFHTCVKKEYRGKIAIEAGIAAGDWMFDNTNAIKLISIVPVSNRPARIYARLIGFKQEGTMKNAWVSGGRPIDLILLGKEI